MRLLEVCVIVMIIAVLGAPDSRQRLRPHPPVSSRGNRFA